MFCIIVTIWTIKKCIKLNIMTVDINNQTMEKIIFEF
jgi:hypothetical protein